MRELISITKALADESRIRILAALRAGELCVCQVVELLDLAPSTVSKHLYLLKQARLVESRKQGRWMYYRLAGPDAPAAAASALKWLGSMAAGERAITADARRLKAILRIDPEALCCQQRQGKRGMCCPAPAGSGSSSSARETRAAARWRRAGRGG